MITRLMDHELEVSGGSASGRWTVGKGAQGGWGVAWLGDLVVLYLCRERDASKKSNDTQ